MGNKKSSRKNKLYVKKMNTLMMLIYGCCAGIAAALISVAYRFSLGFTEDFRVKMFDSANTPLSVLILF